MFFLLVSVAAAGATGSGLPGWYMEHRTHAHTRLSVNTYCHGGGNASDASCQWSTAIPGRSPGSTLGHIAAPSLAQCQQACCRLYGCQAVIYGHDSCALLDRTYNSSYQPGGGTVVSNVMAANRSGAATWTCDPIFENAGAEFASLGVAAYVRHSHTADEGTWWPSATGPNASWHPLVQATGRNLPLEYLTKAKASGVHVILYHYMKCNAYWAAAQPDWAMQWPDGSQIMWPRGPGMSPCSAQWRKLYIAQVVELVQMGADAFFFDEYPGSPGGDWNPACRALYRQRYNADMPTNHTVSTTRGVPQPLSTSRTVLELMSAVTEEYFAELVAAIGNATLHRSPSTVSPRSPHPARTPPATAPSFEGDVGPPEAAVALVSTHLVPAPDSAGLLYESTRLLSHGPNDVAKSEFATGTRVAKCAVNGSGGVAGPPLVAPCYTLAGMAPFPPDVLSAFGWAMMRDGADGRPAHIWIPMTTFQPGPTPERVLCAVVAARAYGLVANPDHAESGIPNRTLFGPTYALSARLDALPSDLRPARHAAVLFSESSRAGWVSGPGGSGALDVAPAWEHVLAPTVGAWGALLRAGVAAGVVNDGQLLGGATSASAGGGVGGATALAEAWPALLAPEAAELTAAVNSGLERYQAAGGTVFRVPTSGWGGFGDRRAAEAQVIDALNASNHLGPVVRSVVAGGLLHTVLLTSASRPDTSVIALATNFTGCTAEGPSTPAVGVTLDLAPPSALPTGVLTSAVELVSNATLKVTRLHGAAGGRGWRIDVGTVEVHAFVVATFGPAVPVPSSRLNQD